MLVVFFVFDLGLAKSILLGKCVQGLFKDRHRRAHQTGANLTDAATDADVRRAYRHLVRATHPDLHPEGDVVSRERRARTLRAAIRAWGIFQGRTPAAA